MRREVDMARRKMRLSATTVVQDERDRFLFICEATGCKTGKWNFPTGRVRQGESANAAASRELWEETGLRVTLDGVVGLYTYASPAGHDAVRAVFHGRYEGGVKDVPTEEILDATWWSKCQLEAVSDDALWTPDVIRRIVADCERKDWLPLDVITPVFPEM